jgi:hypothetical protein
MFSDSRPANSVGHTLDLQAPEGLESENAKLRKLLADAMLDNAPLKDLLAKW